MNAPSDDAAAKVAKNRLAEACRTKDASARLVWAITVGEAVLLGAFALALIDYWLMLPLLFRTVGALGLATMTAIGIIRLVRYYRRPSRPKEVALELEIQRPELGCEISTAAEYLSGERKPTQQYEPELVAALEAQAAQKLSANQVDYAIKSVRPALLLGGTLVAALLFVLLAPVALTALRRTALPLSTAHYTSVQVKPGNVEVPVGSTLEITNVFTGRVPKNPEFHWRPQGQTVWQTAALSRSASGLYLHTLKDLRADLTYRVTGGDAASDEYRITTFVPPEVRDLTIRVDFPTYTKLSPLTQKAPDLTALRASTAQFAIEPSTDLAQAKLRFSALPELALTPGERGLWVGAVKIGKETDYWIELRDKRGHLGVNEKPFHIKPLPDNPPKVEITEPGKDIRASATNKVPIVISAVDDFGIANLKLVFHKLGGTEQEVRLPARDEPNTETIARAELDLSTLGLKEYELVAYHAVAADHNTVDGPGIGKSPVYFIEITNEEGGRCLSQGQAQKVNLLAIQKQIIADTTGVGAAAAAGKWEELTARQRDAAEFGRMYLQAISSGEAPAAAAEMQAAIKDMEAAAESLNRQKRADALPPEEGALAHLYQTLKLMPELENLPTTPQPPQQPPPASPKVRVVLEAIKQKQKTPADNQEIEKALQEAKNLARSQSGLNAAMRQAGESAGAGRSPNASPNQGKGQAQSKGQGKGAGQGEGEGEGEATGSPQQASAKQPGTQESQSPAQMAQQEAQLSQAAAALAERLKRMAGKDSRLGHNAGGKAGQAAASMAAAAQALHQGSSSAAGEHGFQGEQALRTLVAQLERLLKNQPAPTDIAAEDFPKEYEALIAEYFKKLSHAE